MIIKLKKWTEERTGFGRLYTPEDPRYDSTFQHITNGLCAVDGSYLHSHAVPIGKLHGITIQIQDPNGDWQDV